MASIANRLPNMPRKRMALFLCIGGGLVLLMALITFLGNLQNSLTYLDAHIELTQGELENTNLPLPEVVELQSELESRQASLDALTTLESSITAARFDWPGIMRAMGNYDPSRLSLASFDQEGRRITVYGTAADDLAVSAYARSLEASGMFSRVEIQSMKVVNVPFAGMQAEDPSGGIIAVTPTPTATAVPGDAYEPDNVDPRSIFPGQPQAHTFWPDGDIDRVKLLAKAGRYYRISTSKLAPGVDTVVVVSVGGRYYQGDDRKPGDLSTEVVFCADGSQDTEALIEVTNRGEYGPDKGYQLSVDEVIPTPTMVPTMMPTHALPTATHIPPTVFVPTATHAPTALPSQTPLPTVTTMPTATPTLTLAPTSEPLPELSDAYEPDEHSPAPISIGERQRHSFHDEDDVVDCVQFTASGAATYRVRTFDLVPGVRTSLLVKAGSAVYVDDDDGNGDGSSEVVFTVGAGETPNVVVSVYNSSRRPFYGPAMEYWLEVVKVEPTLEPTAGSESKVAGWRRAPGLAAVRYPAGEDKAGGARLQGQTGTEPGAPEQTPVYGKSVEFVIILEPRS
jgi:Tfp pilus assembly protein PilN